MSPGQGFTKPSDEREISDPVQRDAVNLIRRIVNETGLSATQIARYSGLSPSTLTRMYPVPAVSYTLTTRSLDKIKRAFPMFEEELSTAAPVRTNLREISVYTFAEEIGASAAPQLARDPKLAQQFSEVEAWTGLLAEPISQTGWLQDEQNKDRFFGVFIAGDDMYPRLAPGEIAIVDTVRPAGANCDALITILLDNEEEMIFFAFIVERRASHISIRFHADTEGKSIRVPRDLIVEMLPVIGILTSGR